MTHEIKIFFKGHSLSPVYIKNIFCLVLIFRLSILEIKNCGIFTIMDLWSSKIKIVEIFQFGSPFVKNLWIDWHTHKYFLPAFSGGCILCARFPFIVLLPLPGGHTVNPCAEPNWQIHWTKVLLCLAFPRQNPSQIREEWQKCLI